MKTKLRLLCLSGTVALMSTLIPHAMADQWNKRTEFTFSGPVQIPGKTLPAGKYVFQLADSMSNRDIVQIFSEDPKGDLTLMATILAVPEYRLKTPDKALVNFEERPSGTPEAIDSWFYPGENTGWEFVYRKQDTAMMASNDTPASAPVSVPGPAANDTPVVADEPAVTDAPPVTAQEVPADEVSAKTEEEVLTAVEDQDPTPAAVPAPDQASEADRSLPETAGYSGMALLTGFAMLGCGGALLMARRMFQG